MDMQPKRKRKHKRKHKQASSDITLDKHSIIKHLQKLNFSLDHILRAIKVFEHNYGKNYNFNALTEIIVRLQKKDAAKYENSQTRHSLKEEKRDTTKYIIDDHKDQQRGQSLSLSISSNANYYAFDIGNNKKKKKPPKLLRRHTDNDNIALNEDIQYESKPKKRRDTHRKHRNSISYDYETPNRLNIISDRHYSKSASRGPFVPFMSVSECRKALQLFENVDHRDFVGKHCIATVIDIDINNEYNVLIHYDGYCDNKYDIWSNYKTEPFRFAKYRSISRRFQDRNDREQNQNNTVYKCNIKIGDYVFINPKYTAFGGQWYKGIINKFDKKSDQIQIAYKPMNSNDSVLYWSHIDNCEEIKPFYQSSNRNSNQSMNVNNSYHLNANVANINVNNIKTMNNNVTPTHIFEAYELQELPEQNSFRHQRKNGKHKREKSPKKSKVKSVSESENKNFSEWNTESVIEWIKCIDNGKFSDEVFDHFREQISIIQLKGYELMTLNETALKFAGLLNRNDRKIIINNVLNLVNKNCVFSNEDMQSVTNTNRAFFPELKKEYTLDGFGNDEHTIDVDLNMKLKRKRTRSTVSDGGYDRRGDDRVLNEVMGLWKNGSV